MNTKVEVEAARDTVPTLQHRLAELSPNQVKHATAHVRTNGLDVEKGVSEGNGNIFLRPHLVINRFLQPRYNVHGERERVGALLWVNAALAWPANYTDTYQVNSNQDRARLNRDGSGEGRYHVLAEHEARHGDLIV